MDNELERSFPALSTGRQCAGVGLESSWDEIVIYGDEHGWPTHVARQLHDGSWTSKLGASEDIAHASVEHQTCGRLKPVLPRT